MTALGERDASGEPAVKRRQLHNCALVQSSPLNKDELLEHVLGYVGGGDHLYVAGVSRRWRGRYLQYCVLSTTFAQDNKFVTRHRNTIVSKSRLLHAKLNNFDVSALDMTQDKIADLICGDSLEAWSHSCGCILYHGTL
jgi:hypothetical protein